MKYKWMLKNVQLRTPEKDDYKAAQEVVDALKKSKKFDGTKIFLCKQVAGIAVPKGEKQDPYVHSFTFVSNDKDELQKLADNFNKILFPNHEKDELLGLNIRKNTDNYEDVFESKKIKAETEDETQQLVDKWTNDSDELEEMFHELLRKQEGYIYNHNSLGGDELNESVAFFEYAIDFLENLSGYGISNITQTSEFQKFKKAVKEFKTKYEGIKF